MRIFLVFGCQDDNLKTVRKMAVLHLQIAKFSASGGGKGPPAAPAAGVGGSFASQTRKSDPPDRPNAPKFEPISLFPGCFDDILTHKAQIGPPYPTHVILGSTPPCGGHLSGAACRVRASTVVLFACMAGRLEMFRMTRRAAWTVVRAFYRSDR